MLWLLEAGLCVQVWPVAGLKGPTWKEKRSWPYLEGYTFLYDLNNFKNGDNITVNTFVLQLNEWCLIYQDVNVQSWRVLIQDIYCYKIWINGLEMHSVSSKFCKYSTIGLVLKHFQVINVVFYPPRWALHRGQVATVQENPGNQEKRLSAGQCCLMSAFLKVITSNWCPWGFSKSWTLTLRPPTTVSLRLTRASRLGTKWMSVP